MASFDQENCPTQSLANVLRIFMAMTTKYFAKNTINVSCLSNFSHSHGIFLGPQLFTV
jgi:hypothetical protein